MHFTTLLLCRENERQWSINDLGPSILENQWVMWPQWSIIVLSAAFLGNYAYDKIVTMSQIERQQSGHDLCTGILDNPTGMERRWTTMNLSAGFVGNNDSEDIASASNNWALTVPHGSECYTAIHSIILFPNWVLRGQWLQSVLVINFPNMHVIWYWSEYFPCSSRVNI
jgi:hypothetical protein